jgi:transposase-like protein
VSYGQAHRFTRRARRVRWVILPTGQTIWSTHSSLRGPPHLPINKEIRRRTDVVGIFPDRTSIIRLVGAVLAEQHDEWIESRRYLGLDVLTRSRAVLATSDPTTSQPTTPALTA